MKNLLFLAAIAFMMTGCFAPINSVYGNAPLLEKGEKNHSQHNEFEGDSIGVKLNKNIGGSIAYGLTAEAMFGLRLSEKMKPFIVENLRVGFEIGKTTGLQNITSGLSFGFIARNNWMLECDFRKLKYKSEFLPSNYSAGGGLIIGTLTPNPRDEMETQSLLLGKSYGSKEKRFRIAGMIGFSKLNFSQAKYQPAPGSWQITDPVFGFLSEFVSSHTVSYERKKSYGMRLKARFDLPLFKYCGIGISGYTDLNKIRSFSGGSVSLNIGLL